MCEAYFEDTSGSGDAIKYPFTCYIEEPVNRDLYVDPHWHYYIELLYFVSGRADIVLGGKCCSVKKGDMVLINAREVHSIAARKNSGTKYYVLKFDPEVLYTTSRTVFESKYVLPFTMSQSPYQKIFTADEIEGTDIPALVEDIYNEYNSKQYGFEMAVRTSICRIFLWVLRNWKSKGLSVDLGNIIKEADIKRLQNLFDYLDKHYHEDICTRTAARISCMSYSYFSRQFKKLMGRTFTEYLNYIRVTEAEKLLLTTDMNITQVALSTGFSSSSYFIKQFKHFKNMTPNQLKKSITENI